MIHLGKLYIWKHDTKDTKRNFWVYTYFKMCTSLICSLPNPFSIDFSGDIVICAKQQQGETIRPEESLYAEKHFVDRSIYHS